MRQSNIWLQLAATAMLLHRVLVSAYKFEFIASSSIEGQHYPANEYGTECSREDYSMSPCQCHGGAARRAGVIAKRKEEAILEGKHGVVALDLGASFYGSGLFFPVFGGSVGASLFERQGYMVRSLAPRDFAAGITAHEPTGGKLLAEYLAHSLRAGPAVASNLDLQGDPYLDNRTLVTDYVTLELVPGFKIAFVNLIDREQLSLVSPYYASRTINYERALAMAIAGLASNGFENLPKVVLVTLHGLDNANQIMDDDYPFGADDENARQQEELYSFALRFIFMDAVFVDGNSLTGLSYGNQRLFALKNWADADANIAVTDSTSLGFTLTNITLEFDEEGVLNSTSSARGIIPLDCMATEDPLVRQELDALKATVDGALNDEVVGHVGFVDSIVDASMLIPGGTCVALASSSSTMCGCAITECSAGNLVADAVQWFSNADVAFVAAGALKKSVLPYQVRKSHVLDLVPDLGDEIVRISNVQGRKIRRILTKSISRLVEEAHDLNAAKESGDSVYGGRYFLQVSSSLQFSWFYLSGTPTLEDVVLVNGKQLDDSGNYSIAGSSRLFATVEIDSNPTLIYSDELGTDDDMTTHYLATQHFEAVSDYILHFHGTENSSLNPELTYNIPSQTSSPYHRRIIQTKDVLLVHVAVLCGSSLARREQCDHALHAVDKVNDHADGFHDDLLPSVRIIAHDLTVGCVEGRAFGGLVELAHTLSPDPISAVILTCSDDVAAVASEAALSQFLEYTGQSQPYIVVSPSATAPSLSNDTAYPYLARLATSEAEVGAAVTALVESYTWRRIALVHDDSLWGTASAQAFIDKFIPRMAVDREILGGGECVAGDRYPCLRSATVESASGDDGTRMTLTAVGIAFSLEAYDRGLISNEEIVEKIGAAGAKIVFLATYPRVQRGIFATSRITGTNFGTGYAWITNLPSEDSLITATGEVDFDAVVGHQGSVGFLEHTPTYDSGGMTAAYADDWAEFASIDACADRSIVSRVSWSYVENNDNESSASQNGWTLAALGEDPDAVNSLSEESPKYCDIDGDPETIAGYGAFWVDSVVTYAKGLDNYLSKFEVLFESASEISASQVYSSIISLPAFNGTSGRIVLSSSNGDRLGKLDLLNMRVVQGDIEGSADEPTRRQLLRQRGGNIRSPHENQLHSPSQQRIVELRSSFAEFVPVGEYVVAERLYTLQAEILWPGGTADIPSDFTEDSQEETDDEQSSGYKRALLVSLFIAAAAFIWTLALVCALAGYLFRLQDFHHRKALVASLRAYEVVKSFDPDQDQVARRV